MDDMIVLKKAINNRKLIKLQKVLREVLVKVYLSPTLLTFDVEFQNTLNNNNLKFKLLERNSEVINGKMEFKLLSEYTGDIILITMSYNV